jgi:predicted RNA-binding protein (virulence factor B family)
MLYKNQIFRPLSLGERTTAYVVKVTEERRIDLSLQRRGYTQVKDSAEQLYDAIVAAGGTLPLNDNSSPELIQQTLQMSKKLFKRSLGVLMSHNRVVVTDDGVKIAK